MAHLPTSKQIPPCGANGSKCDAMLPQLMETLEAFPVFYVASGAAIIAGLATCLGALPLLVMRTISQSVETTMMSFGAGVMLAAAFFSLLLPGLELAETLSPQRAVAPLWVGSALVLGALIFFVADRYVPHEHFIKGPEGGSHDLVRLRRVWLFVFAIAIHNFPEGLSVGVGFAGDNLANGIAITTGISLQNLPEGLVVGAALMSVNYSRAQALGVVALTGLVMSVGGIIGAAFIDLGGSALMPWALGFAAGAMLFVIVDEIIPETHNRGYDRQANVGFLSGFVLMMFLDLTLA
jgi:zinc transporter, ZIP family